MVIWLRCASHHINICHEINIKCELLSGAITRNYFVAERNCLVVLFFQL